MLALVICFSMIFGGMAGTAMAQNNEPVDEIVCDGDEPAEGAGILAFIISLLVYAAIVAAVLAALVSLVTGFLDGGQAQGVGTIVDNMKSVVGVVIIIYLIVLFAEPLFGFNVGCLFPFV